MRGDINAILNPLVADGTIKGFSTNLYEKPLPEQPVVTVLVESHNEAEEVCRQISQVLAPFGQHIAVQAEVRGQRGRQAPEDQL